MWTCVLRIKPAQNFSNKFTINGTPIARLSPSVIGASREYQRSSSFNASRAASSSVNASRAASSSSVNASRAAAPTTISARFPGFTPVFSFPYIRGLRIACRLKIYQTIVTCCCIPVGLNWMSQGLITPPVLGVLTGFAGCAIVMLGAVGEVSRKIVGILYVNKKTNEVVFSHMNFFGNRRDERFELEDIIPINETPESVDEIYWKIHTYSGRKFYVTTRLGGVLDKDGFIKIFGDPNLGLQKQNPNHGLPKEE